MSALDDTADRTPAPGGAGPRAGLRWPLPPALDTVVLAEFSWRAARLGVPAFAALVAGGFALFGWHGWVQHAAELWVAFALPFALLAWLRARSGGRIATRSVMLAALLGCAAGALAAAPIGLLTTFVEDRTAAAFARHAGGAFLFALALTLLHLSIGVLLARQRRQADAQQRALRLERELLASRLAVLQAQIEPHFLYNTLANVQALTRRDPAAAERMLDHLIDYLRAAMPAMRSSGSTLGREFDLGRALLSIMQFRMGTRLEFSTQLPDELRGQPFPPTVLGTLIENAIKHGLEPARDGGRIDVRAWREGDSLRLEVADTGVGFSASAGSGVGLANARERLAVLYGARAELDLAVNEAAGHGVIAQLRVPLQPSAAAAPDPSSSPLS